MASPVSIDWKKQAVLRDRASERKSDSLVFLLLPEVSTLLNQEHDHEKRLLFYTMWLTGAKATEVIALTRADFLFSSKVARIRLGQRAIREVPVYDRIYIRELKRFIKTKSAKERIWPITRISVNRWFATMKKNGMLDDLPVLAKTITVSCLRNSFAMNWLIYGAPVHLLVDIMGYKHPDSVAHFLTYLEFDQDSLFRDIPFR